MIKDAFRIYSAAPPVPDVGTLSHNSSTYFFKGASG